MSQAIVDPLELRRFAHHLKQFNGDLRERLSGLHAEMTRLSDTWRDQEHEKFTYEFEQTLHVIEHFLDISDQHVPFLQRKAERIEEYLQQH
ncbi:MAG: WXG100 family type VII secretion target [Planctomycetes bacterium]|nr:WXG100 family type VII secretion target [Planctomycetota bacterium]